MLHGVYYFKDGDGRPQVYIDAQNDHVGSSPHILIHMAWCCCFKDRDSRPQFYALRTTYHST